MRNLVLLTCVDIGPWMHGNADVLMSHIVSSERTSRLPACIIIIQNEVIYVIMQ